VTLILFRRSLKESTDRLSLDMIVETFIRCSLFFIWTVAGLTYPLWRIPPLSGEGVLTGGRLYNSFSLSFLKKKTCAVVGSSCIS